MEESISIGNRDVLLIKAELTKLVTLVNLVELKSVVVPHYSTVFSDNFRETTVRINVELFDAYLKKIKVNSLSKYDVLNQLLFQFVNQI